MKANIALTIQNPIDTDYVNTRNDTRIAQVIAGVALGIGDKTLFDRLANGAAFEIKNSKGVVAHIKGCDDGELPPSNKDTAVISMVMKGDILNGRNASSEVSRILRDISARINAGHYKFSVCDMDGIRVCNFSLNPLMPRVGCGIPNKKNGADIDMEEALEDGRVFKAIVGPSPDREPADRYLVTGHLGGLGLEPHAVLVNAKGKNKVVILKTLLINDGYNSNLCQLTHGCFAENADRYAVENARYFKR